MNTTEIAAGILQLLQEKIIRSGLNPEELDQSASLLMQGVLDSLSFIEFLTELEAHFDVTIEFDSLDIADLTSVQQLAQLIAALLQEANNA